MKNKYSESQLFIHTGIISLRFAIELWQYIVLCVSNRAAFQMQFIFVNKEVGTIYSSVLTLTLLELIGKLLQNLALSKNRPLSMVASSPFLMS